MKKSLFASLLSLTAMAFAEPTIAIPDATSAIATEIKSNSIPPSQKMNELKQGFFYVRFAAGEHNMAQTSALVPGLGLGYRLMAGDGAADISFSGIGFFEHRNARYFWTAPKASYCHYLTPQAEKSLYVGGGLAWGGVRERRWEPNDDDYLSDYKDSSFIGIIPSATIGYEFARRTSFLGFTEFTVSQPLLAVSREGSYPGPIAELSLGVGF
jgi:hypothetical protein